MNNEVKEVLKYYNNKILFHQDFLNVSFESVEEFIINKVNEEYKDKDIAFIVVTDKLDEGRKLCNHLVDKNQFCTAETYEAEKSNTLEVYCCSIETKKYRVATDVDFNQNQYRYINFSGLDKEDSDFYIFDKTNENIDEAKIKNEHLFIATSDDVEKPDVDLIIPREYLDSYLGLLEKFASPRVVITMHDDEFIKRARGRMIFSKRYEYCYDEECIAEIANDMAHRDLDGCAYVFLSEYNPMMLFKIGTVIGGRFPAMYINQCAAAKAYGNKKKYAEILILN